jgi:hypothetical protein
VTLVMNTHQHDREDAHDRWRARLLSASLSYSLIMASVVGVIVAAVGIALFALSLYLQIPWRIAAAAGGVGQVVIVTALVMIVLEQRRKKLMRLSQEFTFLNHHIGNAITQMTMASYIGDLDKQQRIRSEALERISGALSRIASSADLDALSLDVDLTGAKLAQEGSTGEEGVQKRTA